MTYMTRFANVAAAALLAAALLPSCGSGGSGASGTADSSATDSMLVSAAGAPNTLSAAEKEEGWQLLFNGHDLSGWHSYLRESPGSSWTVQDGALVLDTTGRVDGAIRDGGDLVSAATFGDFDLKLEWKIEPCGNSGIIFYVQEDKKYPRTWHTGPEMQVLDNTCNPDAKISKHHAGDLYDLVSSDPATVRAAGEWNQVEIISKGGDLQFFLNGQQVLHTTLWNEDWKALVAGSKFKDMPGFGSFRSGHLALQDHGFMVWYRNIRIKTL